MERIRTETSGAWPLDLARRLQPGQLRHFDVEDRQVGPLPHRQLPRFGPVGGLGHHLDVGLALQQQPQPRPHNPMVIRNQHPASAQSGRWAYLSEREATYRPVGRQSAGDVETDGGAVVGARLDRQLAADQQRPLAHAGDAEAVLGLARRRSRGRRRRPRARRRSPVRRRRTSIRLGAAVAGGVGERLLGDPVDDQLDVVVEVGEVARRRRARASSPGRASCSTWPAIAAARPRSSSAVGRSWRASESSSRIAWLASALVSASSASSSGGAASRTASSRSSRPVSDWLTSSWRSRATRARSSSWARRAAEPGPPPLGFEPAHHPQEGELDPLHLLGLADAVDRGRQDRPGPAQVDLLHLLDQRFQRRVAAPHAQQGDAKRQTATIQARQ